MIKAKGTIDERETLVIEFTQQEIERLQAGESIFEDGLLFVYDHDVADLNTKIARNSGLDPGTAVRAIAQAVKLRTEPK